MDRQLNFSLLVLTPETLASLSAKDKKRLLMLTIILRDMALIRKFLIYAKQQDLNDENLSTSAYVTITFSLIKQLISKVFEAWEFLRKEDVQDQRILFSRDLVAWWEKNKLFFSVTKNRELFSFVRNKFGFHFDHYEEIEPYIERAMVDIGSMLFWFAEEQSGNDIFASSNQVMVLVLKNKMHELGYEGEDREIINTLIGMALDTSHNMNEFCKLYLIEVLLSGHAFNEERRVLSTVPLLSEINLPLISKNDMSMA